MRGAARGAGRGCGRGGESKARRLERLARRARALPSEPGAYLFLDARGRVIYVGKAKSLRARVRTYFAPGPETPPKVARMVESTREIEFIVTRSETEALLLEYNLIKEHRPRYNVVYRDDKKYPYLKVTLGETFPRVFPTRRVEEDGARYFGPYTDVGAMRRTLRLLGSVFALPTCRLHLREGMSERGCLDYFLGRCMGPCRGDVDPSGYRAVVKEVLLFLEGKRDDVVRRLEREMESAARALRFEEAAKLRDRLFSLRRTVVSQHVSLKHKREADVVGLARGNEEAVGVLLQVRRGRVLGRERMEIRCRGEDSEGEVLRGLLLGFYQARERIPGEILLPAEPSEGALLERWLTERRGGRVRLSCPRRGEGRRLVEMASTNAAVAIETEEAFAGGGASGGMGEARELARALGLGGPAQRIEGFDVSTIQGTDTYASLVVFVGGRPAKAEYRTLRIRSAPRRDDPRAIEEAVRRRARQIAMGAPKPDLVLIDGGPTQLEGALRALRAEGLGELAVVSLAKREELLHLPARREPLRLARDSAALRLLERVRDEAHRFALRAHRRRRGERVSASILEEVPGIGPARRRALLQRFGSVERMRRAGREEIAAVPGVGRALARAIWAHLGGVEER